MVAYELIVAGCALGGPLVGYGGYLIVSGRGMDDSLAQKNAEVYRGLLKQVAPKARTWAKKVVVTTTDEELIPYLDELTTIHKWGDLWRRWNRHGSRMDQLVSNVGMWLMVVGLGLAGVFTIAGVSESVPGALPFLVLLAVYALTFPATFLTRNMYGYAKRRREILAKFEELNMQRVAFAEEDLPED
jgi:hypothetical protein